MFKKFRFNHWQIAYRLKGMEKFELIPNPSWGWAADPFIVKYNQCIYIFAELYLYKSERNGVIGYCTYQDGRFSEWTVSMDKHWHLSYPNVFVYNEKLFMCPESYQNEEIAIYELKELPDKWEKVCVLINNEKYVDTTFLEIEKEKYMFTFRPTFEKNNGGTLYLYKMSGKLLSEAVIISNDIGSARPGGNILKKNGKLIRVSQNNINGYGTGLIFSEIDSIYPDYQEHAVRKVFPKDIPGNWNRHFIGIHTYNRIEEMEVIDLKYIKYSMKEHWARKRVRKVFVNKYQL